MLKRRVTNTSPNSGRNSCSIRASWSIFIVECCPSVGSWVPQLRVGFALWEDSENEGFRFKYRSSNSKSDGTTGLNSLLSRPRAADLTRISSCFPPMHCNYPQREIAGGRPLNCL